MEFVPGQDYMVKNEGTARWRPLPDCEATQQLRDLWVFVRRERPACPKFSRCPMPKHGKQTEDQRERNGRIILAYFHPFTVREDAADQSVPYLGCMKPSSGSWHEALLSWFSAGLLTHESQRYVQNFLNVTQCRPPSTQDLLGNSDDCISDEECDLSRSRLHTLLKTTMGGGGLEGAEGSVDVAQVKSAQEAGAELAEEIWALKPERNIGESFEENESDAGDVKRMMAGALSSQASTGTNSEETGIRSGKFMQTVSCSNADIEQLLRGVKLAADPVSGDGIRPAHFDVLDRVVKRVLMERRQEVDPRLRAAAPEDPKNSHFMSPLFWMVHGGPGVGKTYVTSKIQELFSTVLGWVSGIEHQVAALQAVMADLINGDTIHHALGIDPFGGAGNQAVIDRGGQNTRAYAVANN